MTCIYILISEQENRFHFSFPHLCCFMKVDAVVTLVRLCHVYLHEEMAYVYCGEGGESVPYVTLIC